MYNEQNVKYPLGSPQAAIASPPPKDQQVFINRTCILLAAWISLSATLFADQHSADEQYFNENVLPIFTAKCFDCHGAKVQKSGYRLDVREIALAGGDLGEPPIVPGNSSSSSLLSYVADNFADLVMPPRESNVTRLTTAEVGVLQKWIDDGAAWPDSANERSMIRWIGGA